MSTPDENSEIQGKEGAMDLDWFLLCMGYFFNANFAHYAFNLFYSTRLYSVL